MDPLLVLIGGPIAILAIFALALAWHPRRGRELVGELRPWHDHEAMSDIESRDTDQMLDSIEDHRRQAGHRSVGEELGDELLRGSWDERA
jgi:hypothetical protein